MCSEKHQGNKKPKKEDEQWKIDRYMSRLNSFNSGLGIDEKECGCVLSQKCEKCDPTWPGKGQKGKRCNRGACDNTEAYYYNRVMRAYYCQPCAWMINESSSASGQGNICSISDEDRKEWNEAKRKEFG